jgi:hypothetical protein
MRSSSSCNEWQSKAQISTLAGSGLLGLAGPFAVNATVTVVHKYTTAFHISLQQHLV